jgi:hypothetical protein
MHKKAQSQIITTVLIILLVLAAIVIVWQVVNSTIRGGATQIEASSDCIGIQLTVEDISCAAGDLSAVIRRGPDQATYSKLKVILDSGNPVDITGGDVPGPLGTYTYTKAAAGTGQHTVGVAATILNEDGTEITCGVSDSSAVLC